MKSVRIYMFTAFACMAMLIAGCWAPENFKATVTIHKDGSYVFTYEGVLKLLADDYSYESLDTEEKIDSFFKEPMFKKVENLGMGRYKVSVEKECLPKEHLDFMGSPSNLYETSLFSIHPLNNDTSNIKITSKYIEKKLLIEQYGEIPPEYKDMFRGTLTVNLDKGVKVINLNAENTPKIFGIYASYEWNYRWLTDPPLIIVQPLFNTDEKKILKHEEVAVKYLEALCQGNVNKTNALSEVPFAFSENENAFSILTKKEQVEKMHSQLVEEMGFDSFNYSVKGAKDAPELGKNFPLDYFVYKIMLFEGQGKDKQEIGGFYIYVKNSANPKVVGFSPGTD